MVEKERGKGMKYREFTLGINELKDYETVYPNDFDPGDSYDLVKVIEKAAYTDLQGQCERLVGALEDIDQSLCERIIDPYGYDPDKEDKKSLVCSMKALSDENESDLALLRDALASYEKFKGEQ